MRRALYMMMTLTLGCAGSQDVIMAMDDPTDGPQAASEEQPGEPELDPATEPEAAPGQNAVQAAAPVPPVPAVTPACDIAFLERTQVEAVEKLRQEARGQTQREQEALKAIREFIQGLHFGEQTVPPADPELPRPAPLQWEVSIVEYPITAQMVKGVCTATMVGPPLMQQTHEFDIELSWSRVASLWMRRYADTNPGEATTDEDLLTLMGRLMQIPPLDYAGEIGSRLSGPSKYPTEISTILQTDLDLMRFTSWLLAWLPSYAQEDDPKSFRRMVNLLWKFSAENPPTADDADVDPLAAALKAMDPKHRLLLRATLVELSEALGIDAVVVLDRSIEVLKKLKDAEMESKTKLARLDRLSKVLERAMQQVRSQRQ